MRLIWGSIKQNIALDRKCLEKIDQHEFRKHTLLKTMMQNLLHRKYGGLDRTEIVKTLHFVFLMLSPERT